MCLLLYQDFVTHTLGSLSIAWTPVYPNVAAEKMHLLMVTVYFLSHIDFKMLQHCGRTAFRAQKDNWNIDLSWDPECFAAIISKISIHWFLYTCLSCPVHGHRRLESIPARTLQQKFSSSSQQLCTSFLWVSLVHQRTPHAHADRPLAFSHRAQAEIIVSRSSHLVKCKAARMTFPWWIVVYCSLGSQ